MQHSNPLSTAELNSRHMLEARIMTRASGRIGDGLDLIAIRDGSLYRDHATFEEYVSATFGVAPGSAYRWIAAAETVKDMIEKMSPSGETDDPKAWHALLKHRNETAIRYLQQLRSAEDRWAVYRQAVIATKGPEPKPRHLVQAAKSLGYMPQEDPRDHRTLNRIRALQLIRDVRDSAQHDGRKLWAHKLTDALHRLGHHPDRVPAPRMPQRSRMTS